MRARTGPSCSAFRDHLVGHRTVEAAYLDLVRRGVGNTPPLFINQLVHVILRNALDGCEDAYMLRAAELFFRPQRLTVHEGSLIAADEETVAGVSTQPVSPLVSMLGLPAAAEIDVLNDDNAQSYWERSDLFDMALDLTAGRRGLAALGDVIGAVDLASPVGRGRRRGADRGHRCRASPGMSVSTPRHPDRRRAVERRRARRGRARRASSVSTA